MTFRSLFAFIAFFNLDIDLIDVKTAFFYDLIDQFISIEIPKETEMEIIKNIVCKLLKTLYSLKQSLYLWYEKFSAFFLINLDLIQIHIDYNIFVSKASIKGPVFSIFVNNIKIMVPKRSGIIEKVK